MMSSSPAGASTTSRRWATPSGCSTTPTPSWSITSRARSGGIGANRANPGRYWFANLMMGAHVLEQARLCETPKLVIAGTLCSYPKFTEVPFKEADLWLGYPEETNAPYGVAKKAILVGAQAYREQYGLERDLPPPDEPLRASRQLRPRDLARDSGADPQDARGAGAGRGRDRALGRRLADARVSLRGDCVDGLLAAAERYDGPEPVNLGTGVETSIRETAELVAAEVGYEGSIVWDSSMPNGQPRRSLDVTRARELFGFTAKVSLRDGIARTVAWYRDARVVA